MAGKAFAIRRRAPASSFCPRILLARWMGSSEFGFYISVWTWLLLAGAPRSSGHAVDRAALHPGVQPQQRFDALRGFLAAAAGSPSSWERRSRLPARLHSRAHAVAQPQDRPAVLPGVCVPAFYTLSLMCDGLARSYNWIGWRSRRTRCCAPPCLFALMALAYAAGFPVDATTTMIALALAIWSTSLLQLVLVDRHLAGVVRGGRRGTKSRAGSRHHCRSPWAWSFNTMLCYADVLVLQQFGRGGGRYYYAAARF